MGASLKSNSIDAAITSVYPQAHYCFFGLWQNWNREFKHTEAGKKQLDALKDALNKSHRNDLVTWIEGMPEEGNYESN